MKNDPICYSRMLDTLGTLASIVVLLSIFVGCAARQAHQSISTKQEKSGASSDAIQNALNSTVRLVLKEANGNSLKIGSGFFVRPGLITTNLYVVEGTVSGYAKLVGQEAKYPIEEIIREEGHGLALLRVTAPGVKPLPLGTGEYRYGTLVYAEQNSSGSRIAFSKGIMTYRSVDNRTISVASGGTVITGDRIIRGPYFYSGNIEWIGLTIPIHGKGSGGPVLNDRGEVVGVSVHRGGIPGKTGNFAISSNTLKSLLNLNK